jgi:hypothetical protein
MSHLVSTERYQQLIEASRRVRWEIERDVIRGRAFDVTRTFMPDGLSLVQEIDFLSPADRRLLSQVQGRTYAYMFGLVERFIGAKVMEITHAHALGDHLAVEALVRMTEEELKHQALFRRLETMMDQCMPAGWHPVAEPNAVAQAVLAKGTWAVLALTLDIELFSQAHFRASILPQAALCPLWKDVFQFHWKEEAQHAMLDELELRRVDAQLSDAERDTGVRELLELVGDIDGILQAQAAADAQYFGTIATCRYSHEQRREIADAVLKAYRWQYIVSGAMEPRFQKVLFGLLSPAQGARVQQALEPLAYAVPSSEAELPLAA